MAALAACGGQTTADDAESSTEVAVNFDGGGPPILDLMVDAHLVQAYRGVQRVELPLTDPPLDYREEIGSTGAGEFAVDPFEMISAHPDENMFFGLASLRAGMTFRYRDFRIADVDQLQQNYVIEVQPDTTNVASITCLSMRVQRTFGSNGHYYMVGVDPLTGLVLHWEERNDIGGLVARVTFETFRYDVDVSDMALQDRLFPTQGFNPTSNLTAAMGFDVLQPSLPPTGYVLDQAELLGTINGEWAKLHYTDGLERVFFMHRPQNTSSFQGNASTGTVRTATIGEWSVIAGNVQGWEVIVAGKVSEDELLDMLQSAL